MTYPIPYHWEETDEPCENCGKPTMGKGITIDFPKILCTKCYEELEGPEVGHRFFNNSQIEVGVEEA